VSVTVFMNTASNDLSPCSRVKILIHTLITTLSFELALPRGEYEGKGDLVQHPVIKGEYEKGRQLPMLVRQVKEL
jgi:hypothetical protein